MTAVHLMSALTALVDPGTSTPPAKTSKSSPISSFIFLGLIVVVAFLFMRSSRKRRAQGEKMQADLVPGVEVITVGGLIATVKAVDDEAVHLEIAPGVVARFVRRSIGTVVTPREPVEDGPVVPDADSHDPDLPEDPRELPPDDRPPSGT
ncbi:MAG TPA: preprotein translocase subunit YajC [Mycobacteriales bacterium]|nr:preprotein translocase subunit YajC [Mycobacteriales bacterium]